MADNTTIEDTNAFALVPSDVWMRILELLPDVADDVFFGEAFLKVTLTFLPLVSKQLYITCKEFKKRRKLGPKFSSNFVMEYFALNGYLLCMKYVHETGSLQWTEDTCKHTAFTGQLETLIYAHENGCPWGRETCEVAASCGQLEILKYAHEHGCPWDEQTCYFAASNGELNCLKYAHESGCSWNATTCSAAADGGYLEVLKYAHENGCPWDLYTLEYARCQGHEDCVQYALQNGCGQATNAINNVFNYFVGPNSNLNNNPTVSASMASLDVD
eukprot:TRINITY_DN14497_c0_g1_i1.p1 TRINITY_DN14497_c0_g1~~TRINITY_DN14497_c0_g1_i1.p1  ORF type:complete len:273 (-),score=19.31 TRINITY_DN14497_c0_g1_i1:127-945(-)